MWLAGENMLVERGELQEILDQMPEGKVDLVGMEGILEALRGMRIWMS